MKPLEGRKRRFGDRNDGFLVRNLDPMGKLIPFIMIIFAAIVRTYSQVPELNRFIARSNIYARNEMKGSMVVMKGMQRDSERTTIMPRFEMDATLKEVSEEIQSLANPIDRTKKVAEDENRNDFDKLELALSLIPNWLISLVFGLLKLLDRHGWIPKKITDLSPFHASFFLTNMGSIGMQPVYHHIYEFGTISIFGAIGSKETVHELDRNGQLRRKTYLNMKFVVDERICDGFIYALGFKHIKSGISKPEQLMERPEKVVQDKIDRK